MLLSIVFLFDQWVLSLQSLQTLQNHQKTEKFFTDKVVRFSNQLVGHQKPMYWIMSFIRTVLATKCLFHAMFHLEGCVSDRLEEKGNRSGIRVLEFVKFQEVSTLIIKKYWIEASKSPAFKSLFGKTSRWVLHISDSSYPRLPSWEIEYSWLNKKVEKTFALNSRKVMTVCKTVAHSIENLCSSWFII